MKKRLQRPRNACFDANDSLPVTQMCKKYREKNIKNNKNGYVWNTWPKKTRILSKNAGFIT